MSYRWDSTYGMLDVALNYEKVFNRLDCMYNNYRLHPSKEE